MYGCTGVTKITSGSNVKKIGVMACKDCQALKELTFKKTTGWEADGISVDSEYLATKTGAVGQVMLYSDKTWRRS